MHLNGLQAAMVLIKRLTHYLRLLPSIIAAYPTFMSLLSEHGVKKSTSLR